MPHLHRELGNLAGKKFNWRPVAPTWLDKKPFGKRVEGTYSFSYVRFAPFFAFLPVRAEAFDGLCSGKIMPRRPIPTLIISRLPSSSYSVNWSLSLPDHDEPIHNA